MFVYAFGLWSSSPRFLRLLLWLAAFSPQRSRSLRALISMPHTKQRRTKETGWPEWKWMDGLEWTGLDWISSPGDHDFEDPKPFKHQSSQLKQLSLCNVPSRNPSKSSARGNRNLNIAPEISHIILAREMSKSNCFGMRSSSSLLSQDIGRDAVRSPK